MPFILTDRVDNATTVLQRVLQRTRDPSIALPLHIMEVSALEPTSLRDELRLHARYIRDTLVPILSPQSKLAHSDYVLLRAILKKLDFTYITLDLIRYSRMEKALMVIAATGAGTWPMELVMMAEELIQKWEDKLGPLKNLRSDLYGPGGRLEGVRKIVDGKKSGLYEKDDEAKSAWSVKVLDPFHSHKYGSLGFEVGDWWLKPAAAYRDGIIDKTSHAISADDGGAYAIVVNGSREVNLQRDGTFVYHAALDDPGALKLMKTMTNDTEKIVRVLRSWKLRSKLAPKAGLRYDGLYRIKSFGIKLIPPNSWHKTFTLSRLSDQPPISSALAYPKSDQLDDWRDYQRLKNVDRGDDFAMLREMLREPTLEVDKNFDSEDRERIDSGYFSRRSSKLPSRVNSIANTMSDRTIEMPFNNPSRFDSLASSSLENPSELEFTLVAEGTPSTPDSEPRTVCPTEAMSSLDGAQDPDEPSHSEDDLDRRTSQYSNWRHDSGAGLDGTEEASRFFNWPVARRLRDNDEARFFSRPATRRHSEVEADELEERIAPEETPRGSLEVGRGMMGGTRQRGVADSLQEEGDSVVRGEEEARRRWFMVREE